MTRDKKAGKCGEKLKYTLVLIFTFGTIGQCLGFFFISVTDQLVFDLFKILLIFLIKTISLGLEMTALADFLQYDREVIRVWFCNKRQATKSTIKRMKVSMVPTIRQ